MVQLRIPAIAFCHGQPEARGGFVELPIGPITQFFGAGQGAKPSHELQTDSINIQSDKVSDKVSDKERKTNPTPNSKMSKLQKADTLVNACQATVA